MFIRPRQVSKQEKLNLEIGFLYILRFSFSMKMEKCASSDDDLAHFSPGNKKLLCSIKHNKLNERIFLMAE